MTDSFEDVSAELTAHDIPVMPWGKLFHEYNPDMYRAYVEWTTKSRQHVELEPKVREMISIAINCVVMWPSPYFDFHVNRALDEGATVQELADVVLATGRVMGPHSYTHGLYALDNAVKDRAARGEPVPRRRSDLSAESTGS